MGVGRGQRGWGCYLPAACGRDPTSGAPVGVAAVYPPST